MRIKLDVEMDIKTKQVAKQVNKATEKSIKDVVVLIAADAIKGSPVLTGNNRRSIAFEAKGLQGSIFSTSGYGGFIETGTTTMAARPYFKPALDKNISKLPSGIKAELK